MNPTPDYLRRLATRPSLADNRAGRMAISQALTGAAALIENVAQAFRCRICETADGELTTFCEKCLGGSSLSVSVLRAILNAKPTPIASLTSAPASGSIVCIPGRGALVGSKWMRGIVAESDGDKGFAVVWLNGETATYSLSPRKVVGNGET